MSDQNKGEKETIGSRLRERKASTDVRQAKQTVSFATTKIVHEYISTERQKKTTEAKSGEMASKEQEEIKRLKKDLEELANQAEHQKKRYEEKIAVLERESSNISKDEARKAAEKATSETEEKMKKQLEEANQRTFAVQAEMEEQLENERRASQRAIQEERERATRIEREIEARVERQINNVRHAREETPEDERRSLNGSMASARLGIGRGTTSRAAMTSAQMTLDAQLQASQARAAMETIQRVDQINLSTQMDITSRIEVDRQADEIRRLQRMIGDLTGSVRSVSSTQRFQDPPSHHQDNRELETRMRELPTLLPGDKRALRSFISFAEVIYNSIPGQEVERFNRRIRDKILASDWLDYDEVETNNGWPHLRAMLEEQWRRETTTAQMKEKLRNFEQRPNEAIAAYAKRARTLLKDLNMAERDTTNRQRRENEKRVIRSFKLGVIDRKLRDIMLRKSDEKLEVAEEYAIEQRELLEMVAASQDLMCSFCNYRGHREKNCRLKTSQIRMSNEAANTQHSNFCYNCNTVGHSELQCLVRRPPPQTEEQHHWLES